MPWALYFDGVDDYITANGSLQQGDDFEIEFDLWVSSNKVGCIYCCRSVTGSGVTIFYSVGGNGRLRIDTGGGSAYQWTPDYVVPHFKWTRIRITKDSDYVSLYVDGDFHSQTDNVGTMADLSTVATLGASQLDGSNLGNYLIGYLKNVKILKNGDLDSHWKLNEGEGTIAFDCSGNDNHGTIQGAFWVDNPVNLNLIPLSGGTGGRSGERVYTSPSGVVVTSSAITYGSGTSYWLEYLFDGKWSLSGPYGTTTAYWLGDAPRQSISTLVFDFLRQTQIDLIRVYPRTRDDASSNYRIFVSDDNTTWTEIVPWVNNETAAYGSFKEHTVKISHRYVKFELTRNGLFGPTLSEIEFYSAATPPGRVDISAVLGGMSSMSVGKVDRVKGISATLTGAATATGGTPIRIRGLSANLQGVGTTNIRMSLIAALKAHLQGKATLKSNILVLFVPEGVYVIDADEIFAKDQPSRGQTVVNHVEVWVNPLKPTEEPEEVYRSKDPVTIPAGKTETVTIHFDDEPVTEPAVALEEAGVNLSIVDTKYYAWGADVKIKNAGSGAQTCLVVATGKPLKVQGREKIVKEDPVSIQENGLKKYTFDNPFVQDRATAELIADKLLSFANAKRDIVIEWRGDPALELADVTMIPEYQRRDIDQRGIFYVTKQELEFDGGLRAKLEGRKM